MTPFAFTVPGAPMTWQRTALYNGRRLTPKKQRAYQSKVRMCAVAAGRAPERVRLSRNTKLRWSVALLIACPDAHRRDADNFAKQVGDALIGIFWADDSQIVDWHVRMVVDRERPRLDIVAVAHEEALAPWTLPGMVESLTPGALQWAALLAPAHGDPTEAT